ncbi:MAG TPA: hypothetical protein DEG69_14020 [Flavobacteriaceae bacterium]|nr:hypothetical protein [Flavobacteriaceae bacterium]
MAYIGGLSEDGFYKADTMSPEQKETLDVYIMYMKRRHPKLKVINSKDLNSCKKKYLARTL